jgi:hypothetical protein
METCCVIREATKQYKQQIGEFLIDARYVLEVVPEAAEINELEVASYVRREKAYLRVLFTEFAPAFLESSPRARLLGAIRNLGERRFTRRAERTSSDKKPSMCGASSRMIAW